MTDPFGVRQGKFSADELAHLFAFFVQHRTPLFMLQPAELLEQINRYEGVGYFAVAPMEWQQTCEKLKRIKPVVQAAAAYHAAIEAWIEAEGAAFMEGDAP